MTAALAITVLPGIEPPHAGRRSRRRDVDSEHQDEQSQNRRRKRRPRSASPRLGPLPAAHRLSLGPWAERSSHADEDHRQQGQVSRPPTRHGPWSSAALRIVNSLRNGPNGGEPVIARKPATQSMPDSGKTADQRRGHRSTDLRPVGRQDVARRPGRVRPWSGSG